RVTGRVCRVAGSVEDSPTDAPVRSAKRGTSSAGPGVSRITAARDSGPSANTAPTRAARAGPRPDTGAGDRVHVRLPGRGTASPARGRLDDEREVPVLPSSHTPRIPALARHISGLVMQLHAHEYRNQAALSLPAACSSSGRDRPASSWPK